MNDFSELENQLKKLRPVQPSADLMSRIEHELETEEKSTPTAAVRPRERRSNFNWISLGLGLTAAAALLMFAFVRLQKPTTGKPTIASTSPAPTNTTTAQLVPAGLTQVVYHTRDEGLQFPTSSAQPMRRVRSQTRETLQWRNPKTGATLRISYPREEVSLTPVSGQ